MHFFPNSGQFLEGMRRPEIGNHGIHRQVHPVYIYTYISVYIYIYIIYIYYIYIIMCIYIYIYTTKKRKPPCGLFHEWGDFTTDPRWADPKVHSTTVWSTCQPGWGFLKTHRFFWRSQPIISSTFEKGDFTLLRTKWCYWRLKIILGMGSIWIYELFNLVPGFLHIPRPALGRTWNV